MTATFNKQAALNTKIAAMTDAQKDARIEVLYAKPTLNDDEVIEAYTQLLGDTGPDAEDSSC
jgi:DnaJ-domain-containing protein 1